MPQTPAARSGLTCRWRHAPWTACAGCRRQWACIHYLGLLRPPRETAACCADASNSLWLNLPLAACAVVGVRWLSLQVDVRARADSLAAQRRRRSKGVVRQPLPAPLAPSGKPDSWWRQQVGSPVVERAWETLCGSIVQEARSPLSLA